MAFITGKKNNSTHLRHETVPCSSNTEVGGLEDWKSSIVLGKFEYFESNRALLPSDNYLRQWAGENYIFDEKLMACYIASLLKFWEILSSTFSCWWIAFEHRKSGHDEGIVRGYIRSWIHFRHSSHLPFVPQRLHYHDCASGTLAQIQQ